MRFLLSLLWSLICFGLVAQNGGVKGVVRDAETLEPLPGVHVLYQFNKGIATHFDGQFKIDLPKGHYQITFSYLGYQEQVADIAVEENRYLSLDIMLKPASTLLDGVVVSAGRFEQKLSEVSISMEVIKPKFIEKLNASTMETALNSVPGLTVSDGQASIRGGNGWSYGAASRVLIMVDDLPMLSPDAGDAKFEFIPMENIEQVEVIKGASSALYGSSALNGVVNIRTAWPTKESETKIILNNGIYLSPDRKELKWWDDEIRFYNSTGFLHRRQKGNLDLVLGGNYFRDGGYRTDNFQDRFRYNLGLRYRDKKIHGLAYGVNAGVENVDKIDFLMWQNAKEGAYIHDPTAVSPIKGHRFNVDPFITYFRNEGTKHSLRSRIFRVVNNIEGEGLDNRGDQYFVEYQYHKKIIEKSSVTTGLSTTHAKTEALLYGNHESSNYAVFAQFDTRLWDRFSISVGTRWETYQLDEDTESTDPLFRTGLNYQVAEYTFLRASYGQGYRFPSIAEKYSYSNVSGLQLLPNPTLKSESGWSAEIGIKQGVAIGNWKGYLDLAAYLTEYTDMMEFNYGVYDSITYELIIDPLQYGTNPVGFLSRNVGNARISGIELSVTGTGKIWLFDLDVLAGYNYIVPIDLNSDSVYRASKTTADDYLKYRFSHAAKADVELGYNNWSFGMAYLYNSHIKSIDSYFEWGIILPGLKEYREEHNKGFHKFDFRLAFETKDHFRFAVLLKNAFNKEYMVRPGDIAAPRNLALQVVMNF